MQLYIEPFAGLSGDMFLSGLCELADAYKKIEMLPESLGLLDGAVEFEEVNKNGIVCRKAKVIDLGQGGNASSPGLLLKQHRHYSDILKLIRNGNLSTRAKEIACEIFEIIGEAESRVHKIPLNKIHFHEISGVDSILDIVGCAVLLDELQVKKTFCDPICTGFGSVNTEHGLLPIPAPATASILQGMPTYKGEEKGERVTPTGAAILKFLCPIFELPDIRVSKVAYGPGQRDFNLANVLRISTVDPVPRGQQQLVLESNLDDIPSEYVGADFQSDLLQKGALDVFLTNINMKKGRPGIKLTILTTNEHFDEVANFVFENTTTIGIRYYAVKKVELARNIFEHQSKYGPILVKEVETKSGEIRRKVEYESLRKINRKFGVGLGKLQNELLLDCPKQRTENKFNEET